MKRSKYFFQILWLIVTGGSLIIGFFTGHYKRSFPKSDINIITEAPELIPPGFQIYIFEKYHFKIRVTDGKFSQDSKEVHLASLHFLPKFQNNISQSISPEQISTEFQSLIKKYPQFVPLFWKIEGDKTQLKLKTYGLWIPEDYKNSSLNDLLNQDSLQEWLNQTQISTALNPNYFKFNESRSPERIKNVPLNYLEFLKPEN